MVALGIGGTEDCADDDTQTPLGPDIGAGADGQALKETRKVGATVEQLTPV